MELAAIDYAIVVIYIVGIVLVGTYLGRYVRSGKDFFLAGRRLPWWAIGMSLVVTDIGAKDIIGLAGAAYLFGLVLANYDWLGCVPAMLVAAFIFVPCFWKAGVYTVPEYLGLRYNLAVRSLVAIIWGLFLALNLGVIFSAAAIMFRNLLGGELEIAPLWFAPDFKVSIYVLATAVVVGLYAYFGGLAAVVFTDAAQMIIMFVGCLAIVAFGLVNVGGVGELVSSVRALGDTTAHHFTLLLPADSTSPYAWPAVVFGLGLVLSPAYWLGNQAIIQRTLGARSAFDAKAGVVWAALLKTAIPLLMVVPGLIALAIYPELKKADDALPTLIRELLPPGLVGLVFAAFLAALMSTVDSYLNSAATLWTRDLYQRFLVPHASDRHYLRVGRALTVVFLVIGVGFAPVVETRFSGIFSAMQTLLSMFQGPLLAILLLGMLWRRATRWGGLAGLLLGVGSAFVMFQARGTLFVIEEPFLYIAWWSFVVGMAATVSVSLLTPPEPPEKIDGLVYGRTVKEVAPNAARGV